MVKQSGTATHKRGGYVKNLSFKYTINTTDENMKHELDQHVSQDYFITKYFPIKCIYNSKFREYGNFFTLVSRQNYNRPISWKEP